MANASAKRIASQNEQAVRNLHLGMLLSFSLSLILRLLFRRSSLPPSKGLIALFVITGAPEIFLYRHLVKMGTSKRDATGTLISSGEDLSAPGVTEWCFDILYITWASHVGSSAFGEWFWWVYLIIPSYAVYKAWTSFIRPMFFGGNRSAAEEEEKPAETESKRQQKLRQRQERGDPRVRAVPRR